MNKTKTYIVLTVFIIEIMLLIAFYNLRSIIGMLFISYLLTADGLYLIKYFTKE